MKICEADSDHCDRCAADIQALEQIDDDTDAVGVKFVKTDDASFAKEIGVKEFPTIVYFEKGSPSIYEGKMLSFQIMEEIFWKRSSLLLRPHSIHNIYVTGDPSEEGELLTWLLYQMKEDTIENINRDLLFKMIAEEEFLGVFFCEYRVGLRH